MSSPNCVCQTFNVIGQQSLNDGFIRVERLHAKISKRIKNQLPRRESERRNHYLSRHVDILTGIETRLSLLNMTYMKYMDSGACCFIPGKVLDELSRILRLVTESLQLPRAHEFLLELRDISSMAMEHFDEKIQPTLKSHLVNTCMSLPASFCSKPNNSPVMLMSSRSSPVKHDITQLQEKVKSLMDTNLMHQQEILICQNEVVEQKKKMIEQERKIAENTRLIAQQKTQIDEVRKRSIYCDKKLDELLKKMFAGQTNDSKSVCDKNEMEELSEERASCSTSTNEKPGRDKRRRGTETQDKQSKRSSKKRKQ